MIEHSLRGKIAVVTGGSRGLGRRIAQSLVERGARVAILARKSADLEATAVALGAQAVAIECDVGEPVSVKAAFAKVASRFGALNILVNNAAICELHRVETASDETIRKEIAINLTGPITCCREAIPLLRASGGGDIVCVSSEAVTRPFAYLSVYTATKSGLETFAAVLRQELRPDNIRVMVLRCGHVGESSISSNWPTDTTAEWVQFNKTSGNDVITGAAVSPVTIAVAVSNLLSLPREVNVDLVDIRSNVTPAPI